MSRGPLGETVASALSAREFVAVASDRPVTFFGDTSVQLAGACRKLAVGIEARAKRLNSRLNGASQQIQTLELDVRALGQSVGRPERCQAARSAARSAASTRVTAGVCEAPCHIDRASAELELGRAATTRRVAALSAVGIPLDLAWLPTLDDSLARQGRQAPLARAARAAPVAMGAGGPRALNNTRSAVTVVDPGPLGVTLREVRAGSGEYISLVIYDVQQGSPVEKVAGPGSQLLSINHIDCRFLRSVEAVAKAEEMLRQRPVKLEFDAKRRSIFDAA